MDRRRWLSLLLWLLLLGWIPANAVGGYRICGAEATGSVAVTRGESTIAEFAVTLAASPKEQRRGLMHCPSLDAGTGMLFVYPDARRRVFWMKDTPVELAIIFVTAEGRIAAIAHGQPGSLEHIRSPEAVQSVLEINFGEGRSLVVGDRIHFSPIAD